MISNRNTNSPCQPRGGADGRGHTLEEWVGVGRPMAGKGASHVTSRFKKIYFTNLSIYVSDIKWHNAMHKKSRKLTFGFVFVYLCKNVAAFLKVMKLGLSKELRAPGVPRVWWVVMVGVVGVVGGAYQVLGRAVLSSVYSSHLQETWWVLGDTNITSVIKSTPILAHICRSFNHCNHISQFHIILCMREI